MRCEKALYSRWFYVLSTNKWAWSKDYCHHKCYFYDSRTIPASNNWCGSGFSNLQLKEKTNLLNPLASYSPTFISTLPESSNSLFHKSVHTTTTPTISSPEFPLQSEILPPSSGKIPEQQYHYLF